MDKTWVNLHRLSSEYSTKLNQFLDFAFERSAVNQKNFCPCTKCQNRYRNSRHAVHFHLLVDGMSSRYKTAARWIYHGETGAEHTESSDLNVVIDEIVSGQLNGMGDCLNEVMHQFDGEDDEEPSAHATAHSGRSPEAEQFFKLVEDANSELYPGCTAFKKLDFIVELYQTKVLYGWSDKSFSALMAIIKRALPEGETLPSSFYLTKKLINGLGLTYEKIDVCRNDCMLYWPKNSPAFTATLCSVCNESRWEDPVKQIPSKVFRYFPLCPRLQRLYMSKHTAKHMVWHDVDRVKDGVLRHPADSDCWKKLDAQCPQFAADPRNVRLGLATDGFNPFGQLSNSYSTWPVVLAIYNLPPWMCMKEPYLLMSSLISGPQSPGNDIDVYLQPLIEELKKLWYVGVSTYDVSSDQTFTMRAGLLWTINDFPAYANLSGWSTKGKYACPHCNFQTDSFWLKFGHKYCYRRHRRYLPLSHPYRIERSQFNGLMELDPEPVPPSGSECLQQLEGLSFTVGKGNASLQFRKNDTGPWKKESILGELGNGNLIELDAETLNSAHKYVLFNCEEAKPLLGEHFTELKANNRRKTFMELERMQSDTFSFWLRNKVFHILNEHHQSVPNELQSLAVGPEKWARRYKKYVVNGFRFRTKECDAGKRTQNSGVFLSAHTSSYSSCRARNGPIAEDIEYYGVLTDILELDYRNGKKNVLFGCEWVNVVGTGSGIKRDQYGFTCVNFSRILRTADKFILASQAIQVFYVVDPLDNDWHVVVKTRPRDLYEMN